MSLFELPVSRGARWARIFVVLVLDLALAGTGIAMIIAYVNARSDAADRTEQVSIDAGIEAELEVLDPRPVPNEPADTTGEPVGPNRVSKRSARGKTPTRAKRPKDRRTAGAGKSAPADPPPVSPPKPPPDSKPDPGPPLPAGTPDAGAEEPDEEQISTMSAKIRTVVSRHRSKIKRCYAQAAKVTTPTDPLEGRIDIRFSVNPDGSASGVRVARNTTDSDVLGKCLAGLISTWEFPSGHASPVSFIWPFRFSAPKNQ